MIEPDLKDLYRHCYPQAHVKCGYIMGPKVFLLINVFDMIVVCDNCPSQVKGHFGISGFAPFLLLD